MQALANEPITIYGDGSQTRSFCYVSDLIEAFLRLMDTSGDFSGPVNLGNPNEFTIKQLAEQVIELTDSKSVIDYRPLPSDDPTQRQPDISVARAHLNWAPLVTLDEGLAKTVDYFAREEFSEASADADVVRLRLHGCA
jgi:UDP-glucuronate decarboxylase